MKDQLNFGVEYVSEADIIRRHYQRIGAIGGKVRSEKKAAGSRNNLKIATACRVLKRAGKTVV
jgi:hypothetical protein